MVVGRHAPVQQAIAATLSDDDTSSRAAAARDAALHHRGWDSANEARPPCYA
jgi:hypothetical protein